MKAHVLEFDIDSTNAGSRGSWGQPAEAPTAEISINLIEVEPEEPCAVGESFDIEGTLPYFYDELAFGDFYCEVLEICKQKPGWQKLRVAAGGTITTGPTPPQSQAGRG